MEESGSATGCGGAGDLGDVLADPVVERTEEVEGGHAVLQLRVDVRVASALLERVDGVVAGVAVPDHVDEGDHGAVADEGTSGVRAAHPRPAVLLDADQPLPLEPLEAGARRLAVRRVHAPVLEHRRLDGRGVVGAEPVGGAVLDLMVALRPARARHVDAVDVRPELERLPDFDQSHVVLGHVLEHETVVELDLQARPRLLVEGGDDVQRVVVDAGPDGDRLVLERLLAGVVEAVRRRHHPQFVQDDAGAPARLARQEHYVRELSGLRELVQVLVRVCVQPEVRITHNQHQ